ncbi:MAG: hypothetical protein QOI38_386 [Sphingomonadales bacterium]|jgi:hypothetical protein|nr:hypothetical protein [Sphingomonadales bacterium]
MKYNYPEHHAKSLNAALKLVRYLKRSGKYDLFRGQTHAFPLCPTIARSPSPPPPQPRNASLKLPHSRARIAALMIAPQNQ